MKLFVKVLFILGFLLFGIGELFVDKQSIFHSIMSTTGVLILFIAILLLIWNKVSKL